MTGFFYDLLTWIENHLHSPLRIEDISIKSGYSKWHLQRMFNKYFGISLGKYIRNRKITNAALLIKMSQIPIVEICAENGFSSQQTFTRFLRSTMASHRVTTVKQNLYPALIFRKISP